VQTRRLHSTRWPGRWVSGIAGGGLGSIRATKPNVDRVFDNKKEDVINKTSTLPSAEVLERLKGVDFLGRMSFSVKPSINRFGTGRTKGSPFHFRTFPFQKGRT